MITGQVWDLAEGYGKEAQFTWDQQPGDLSSRELTPGTLSKEAAMPANKATKCSAEFSVLEGSAPVENVIFSSRGPRGSSWKGVSAGVCFQDFESRCRNSEVLC